MQQISPPLRIALVAISLLGAVWFVALRPKADTSAQAPLPQAPGVAGLSSAAGKAQGAAQASSASVERSEQAAAAASGDKAAADVVKTEVTVTKTPAATRATKTATAAKRATRANPAAPLLAALDRGRVVVLLFRNSSTDSSAVAAMVRTIDKRTKVVARVVSISDVGRYRTFTADTPVSQAPTTMVIGPKRRAKVIVGFTSTGEIGQAVADMRRAGG